MCRVSVTVARVPSVRFIVQLSRGLIRNPQTRRQTMFWCTVVALVMLFAGSTLLDRWLRDHPFIFVGFWGVCLWFTLLAVLLAFFDMLLVRASGRRARRKLEREYFPDDKEAGPDDENPR